MFEANYFANVGIPSVLRPAFYEDGSIIENQVFVPHSYDILVDTEAYDEGGLERVDFIFGSILDTNKRFYYCNFFLIFISLFYNQ